MANQETTKGNGNKEFIYGGFKKAPIAMFLTLQSLAIIGLFFWCIRMNGGISENAQKEVERAEKRTDKTVDLVLQILRPDIQQIREDVQQAKENVDSVKEKTLKNKKN